MNKKSGKLRSINEHYHPYCEQYLTTWHHIPRSCPDHSAGNAITPTDNAHLPAAQGGFASQQTASIGKVFVAVDAAGRILKQLGVELHPQKTRIVHVRYGF